MRGFLATILRQLERDGQRCGGPVVLAGFAVGFGLVTLSSSLGQASRFGLELLVLVKLQLMRPVLVSLLAMALLLPSWIDRVVQHGGRSWHHSLPAAMGTGLLLMLMLFVAALVEGGSRIAAGRSGPGGQGAPFGDPADRSASSIDPQRRLPRRVVRVESMAGHERS